MSNPIQNLYPAGVWKNFLSICEIPHPSGHVENLRNFLTDFGRKLSLETIVDKTGNVIIRKPATKGMENCVGVILQAHMDMVPQKNNATQHDFVKDPIKPYIDNGWVTADGTTLGADNGIGMATALAVLEDNTLIHGPIETLFTVDEETGMYGAIGLDGDLINGRILLNMDSEQEGELYVGCAGGVNMTASFQYKEDSEVPEGDVAVAISLTGLKGGHSGLDIILGRANANKLMFRFLKHAVKDFEARLSYVDGGTLRNAIPREASAIITIPGEIVEDILEEVSYYQDIFQDEFRGIEENIVFEAKVVELPKTLIPEEVQDDIINSVVGCFNGVVRMFPDMPSIVETSSNLAIVKSTEGMTEVVFLIRSLNEEQKFFLASSLESVFTLGGAKVEFDGSYPGWDPNVNSPILKLMKDVYEKDFNKEPEVVVIHAGLECGIIGSNVPGLDMISFGPTIKHPHSPDEKVNIDSVEKFWKFTTDILANIPNQ
ncbi:MAG: aminoacyl-histidine dipeptidase [Bacteroidales bacterium]|nr:aminoacyl-histidine dipeptidase [Bacteroidales bacterium]